MTIVFCEVVASCGRRAYDSSKVHYGCHRAVDDVNFLDAREPRSRGWRLFRSVIIHYLDLAHITWKLLFSLCIIIMSEAEKIAVVEGQPTTAHKFVLQLEIPIWNDLN